MAGRTVTLEKPNRSKAVIRRFLIAACRFSKWAKQPESRSNHGLAKKSVSFFRRQVVQLCYSTGNLSRPRQVLQIDQHLHEL